MKLFLAVLLAQVPVWVKFYYAENIEYFFLFFTWSFGDFFLIIYTVQEAGIDGAFCAGYIELASVDNYGHFSSGSGNFGGMNVKVCYEANEQSEKRMIDFLKKVVTITKKVFF